MAKQTTRNPWAWIPTLYFAEGSPYVLVMTVSVIMYKRLEISNTDIALYTSWLYLPWVIKPLWSPIVDILKTKRYWIVAMQLIIGGALAGVAFTIPAGNFFQYTLAFFWLLAFSSATHDIAADGFYMLGLTKHDQAFFIGIRNTFYRIAMLAGQGLFVILAGQMEKITSDIQRAWSLTFFVIAALFMLFFVWHLFILPYPASDSKRQAKSLQQVFSGFGETFISFFKKEGIVLSIIFILIFRLGEAQLVKLASPFLLDNPDVGGLGLSTSNIGFIYGTAGMIALTLGGILGGIVVSRQGLKKWMLPMVFAMNLPNLVYVFLAFIQPQNLWIVTGSVVIEQFGYGFGFTAFMLYLIYISDGKHKTAHYALCTGFMALGMMLPGMISGWIEELIGYKYFFIWVIICTLPGFIIVNYLKYDPKFGMKEKDNR
ncbi:AmpG family muropeptide MFS transporter [Maribellus maritimus]|uniref:AmpG family muropeptide MFS transporter n=1 Tax=Maribellus maritimus TaxID=2870838 RepID=UPI001EEB10BA|nr:AmpG family muropeptide MFS transporter [Maribellus maritimus]MCG6188969.1 AmpG family muropeptide MFS transporter [Maribellus maritimus]